MKRLAMVAAAVIAVWAMFHATDWKPGDWQDQAIIALITGTSALVVLVMLAGTRTWSARATGLMLMSLGAACVYGSGLWVRLTATYTDYPVPGREEPLHLPDKTAPEWMTDLGRAAFCVGIPLLLFGISVWAHGKVPQKAPPPDPPGFFPDGVDRVVYEGPDRRSDAAGRRWGDTR